MNRVTRVELAFAVEGRKREAGRAALETLLARARVEIAAVTAAQAEIATEAFRRFGSGRHPGWLEHRRLFRVRTREIHRGGAAVQGR